MSFKYINPGYAKLLNDVFTQNTNASRNPESGGLNIIGNSNVNAILPIPAATKTLYMSFGLYRTGWGNNCDFLAVNAAGLKKTGLSMSDHLGVERYVINGSSTQLSKLYSLNNTYNKYHIKIVSHATEGVLQIIFNGQHIVNLTNQNIMDGDDITGVYFSMSWDAYVSNIIISDEPISPTEKIIALPVSATTTDMQDNGDGTYTATEAGQTVMQTVDAASLAATIGEASKITGICAIVNPAYYDGDGLSSIKAMKGEAEQGSFALGTDTTGAASASWKENDISIADLGRMSLGWKSAT